MVESVEAAALLLPVPSRSQRYDHQDVSCWQFDGERWLINVCDLEPIDPAKVPDGFDNLMPGVRYLISIGLEPINPSQAGLPSSTGTSPLWQPAAKASASTSSPTSPSAGPLQVDGPRRSVTPDS
jgi:hypothetical protein